jgi:hypothetical protein
MTIEPEKLVPLTRAAKTPALDPDASGTKIMSMLQRAAEMAKEDCQRAMDLAHRLTFQLRAAEERARAMEAELAHVRDRALRAEAWLSRIHNEIDRTFFQNKEQRQAERQLSQTDSSSSHGPMLARPAAE